MNWCAHAHAHAHEHAHYSADPRDSRLYSLIITFFCCGPPHLHLTTCHSRLPCNNKWNHAVITLVALFHWLHSALSQRPLSTLTYISLDHFETFFFFYDFCGLFSALDLHSHVQPFPFLFLSYLAFSPPRKHLCLWPRAAAVCGPGPVVLGGAGAEESGCTRTDRWQSHLLTVQRCGTGRGGAGNGRGRMEGVKAVRLGDRGWGSCSREGSPENRTHPNS